MINASLRAARTAATSVAAIAALSLFALAPAFAQEAEVQITPKPIAPAPAAKPATPAAKPATPAAAPAAKPAAAAPATAGAKPATATATGDNKSAWVKLCEKAPVAAKKDADGKEAAKEDKTLCLTHHERLDGNTGMVLVSAAIREIEGSDKKSLMIMVPLGMAIPPGLRAAVYTKDQWAMAQKNEKIDEKTLKPIDLKYTLCHPAGCTAEIEATAEVLAQMDAGGGIMVLAMNAAAQPVGFPVPLEGYVEAFKGAPIDNQKYAAARGSLMKQIRERQAQLAEKFKEDQKKLPPNIDNSAKPTTTGSTPAAKPAAAPAAKPAAAAPAAP